MVFSFTDWVCFSMCFVYAFLCSSTAAKFKSLHRIPRHQDQKHSKRWKLNLRRWCSETKEQPRKWCSDTVGWCWVSGKEPIITDTHFLNEPIRANIRFTQLLPRVLSVLGRKRERANHKRHILLNEPTRARCRFTQPPVTTGKQFYQV